MQIRHSTVGKIFLALVLLFAQQQAILHALGHDFERIHASAKDSTGQDDVFCAKCLAIAHLDHADGVAWVGFAAAAFVPPRYASTRRDSPEFAVPAPYLSRAPPVFS